VKRILGATITIANGVGELRNRYGTGHRRHRQLQGLGPRHARLAVQNRKAVWNRHDLRVEIDRRLPDYLGAIGPAAVQNVIDELTDKALRPGGEAVKLTALELIPTPDELRRDDGRSVYEPHDGDRFATKRQLALEERLIAAVRETDALRISPERAEELVNASPLAGSQADAVKAILSSGKRLEVAIGYAGAGKSFAMAQLAEMWEAETGRQVMGLTVAERARQVLAEEGITRGANIEKWLTGHRALAQPERILTQHAGNAHRAALTDSEQLGVVEQLSAFGMSAAQITKGTKIKRGTVDASLAVVGSEQLQPRWCLSVVSGTHFARTSCKCVSDEYLDGRATGPLFITKSARFSAVLSSLTAACGPALRSRHSSATALITSIAESAPNPIRATLPAITPATMATKASTTFQATVRYSSHRARRCKVTRRSADHDDPG
jgi:AAA domain/Abortive infection C-terminus